MIVVCAMSNSMLPLLVTALVRSRCRVSIRKRVLCLNGFCVVRIAPSYSHSEQIPGWLKTQYPDDESLRVSHETIYRSLFIQARGVLKKELLDQLRSILFRCPPNAVASTTMRGVDV
jgi:IS30 family transposase